MEQELSIVHQQSIWECTSTNVSLLRPTRQYKRERSHVKTLRPKKL